MQPTIVEHDMSTRLPRRVRSTYHCSQNDPIVRKTGKKAEIDTMLVIRVLNVTHMKDELNEIKEPERSFS